MSKLTKKCLWQGGKSSEKKNHLVFWNTDHLPKSEEGLAIKEFQLMNLELGAKMVW